MSDTATLTLARDRPPERESGVLGHAAGYAIAPGVWILETTPRAIYPHTISALDVLDAIDEAAARLFGQIGHRAALERVAGLRNGALGQWRRREQVPPPHLTAWLAWAASHPEPAQLGLALRLADAAGPEAQGRLAEAVAAYLPEVSP